MELHAKRHYLQFLLEQKKPWGLKEMSLQCEESFPLVSFLCSTKRLLFTPLGGMTSIDLKYENYGTLKPLQNQGPNPFFFFIASTVLTFATIYWPEQKPPMERTSMETGN